jgi:chromosome segregation ATPase
MKKIIHALALNVLVAGALLTSCQTKEQKVEESKQDVKDAKQELKDSRQELNAEYPAFKSNAEEQLAANDKRIAVLRAKLAQPGKSPLDDARAQKIDALEKRNAELRSRLSGYENERSDWGAFKSQFNHDADNLSDAFKDFGNDLKK